jgi:hypothetical protein
MTPIAQTFRLAWTPAIRNAILTLSLLSAIVFELSGTPFYALWIGLLAFPAFLGISALTAPQFSFFELALPVTIRQLLWSRILAVLVILWLPLLIGLGIKWALQKSLLGISQPFQAAVAFTACLCLATLARLTPGPLLERIWALLSLASASLTLLQLDQAGAILVSVAAALPVLANLWQTFAPEERLAASRFAIGRSIWPLLRMLCSWQTPVTCLWAFWVGFSSSWELLFFAFGFLQVHRLPNRVVLGLPISRRSMLAARLLPAVVPFLIGDALHFQAKPLAALLFFATAGICGFLATALLASISSWHRLKSRGQLLMQMLGFLIPPSLMGLMLLARTNWMVGWVQQYSQTLGANAAPMTVALLAAIPLLYWAIETIFNQVEFPDEAKEQA